jgi:hypothetical protein
MEEGRGLSLNRWLSGRSRARNSLIVGGLVLGIVAVCAVAWALFATRGWIGDEAVSRGARSLSGREEAPAQPVVVEAEKIIEMPAVEPASAPQPYTSGATLSEERLIIRTGNISMAVEDTLAAQATIEAMVAEMASQGAYVVSSEEYGAGEEGSPTIMMTLRVPAARFDRVMDRLAELAERVTTRSQSGQDVTEEYVDLEARVESLEAARQRLLGIMEEARTTKDLLEAEQQLTQREAEIESLKGRMQYLAQSARLSSIHVELQPYILSQPVGDRWRPAESVRRAYETLVDGLRGFGDFVIFFAIAILPWLVVIGVVLAVTVLLVRWRSRAGREKRATTGQEPGARP